MNTKLTEIASKGYWRTQVALGTVMMAASQMAMATGAGVGTGFNPDTSNGAGASVDSMVENLTNVPVLLSNISQIAGIWSGYMAWSNWQKVQKGNDSQATPGKTAAYVGGAVLGYFLPSVMGMGGKTLLPGL